MRRRRHPGSSGVSLAEVLVAITVLAMAVSISLVLYDGARRSFKVGDNLAEQQQVVRIAFDKLSRDLAMAGLNANPDGNTKLPDEAIEAAWDTAVVVRADFDGSDPALRLTPEQDLVAAGSAFQSISTGNDEIVGYVLANDKSTESVSFSADVVGVPRDGVLDTVSVGAVAVNQNDPPYTLYRLSVDADSTAVRRVPLVDNVKSLHFTYYDARGSVVPAPGGADDDASKRARASIQRVEIGIEGLTRDPDSRWIDREDAYDKTKEFRKFTLFGDVTPLNLGLVGMKDLDASLSPPSPPPPPVLYPGHCGGLWVDWAPNAAQDEVARYEVRYGKDASCALGPEYTVTPGHYLDGLEDAKEYFVTVTAVDDSGNASAPSYVVSTYTANSGTPETVQSLSASDGTEANVVKLTWDPVLDNVAGSPPMADPTYPRMRDFDRYWVFRNGDPFNPDFKDGWPVVGQTLLPAFDDEKVVNCRPYWYVVTAGDLCGWTGDEIPPVQGRGWTAEPPAAPTNLQAYTTATDIHLVWDPVTRDASGSKIHIEDYTVYLNGSFLQLVLGQTAYTDSTPHGPGVLSYEVSAHDDCVNESLRSAAAEPASCEFVGEVVLLDPQPGQVQPGDPIRVDVAGGSGGYSVSVSIEQAGFTLYGPVPLGNFPPWNASWPIGINAPGLYRVQATAQQTSDGCTQTRSVVVEIGG